MFRRLLVVVSLLTLSSVLPAPQAAAAEDQAAPTWLRYPAVSPDGATVAFVHHGDLYRVPADGGAAIPVTLHAAYDVMPVWSPDGRWLAFASDRYGNFDVWLVPASGGEARRLTFHSADDFPTSFTPDGRGVLFTSHRLDAASCVQFPSRRAQPELYRVDIEGGMPTQVLTTPAMFAVWDRAGQRLAYSDQKGLEDEWRKHDDSSFARDLWIYDAGTRRHTRLTAFGVDDRQPVWAPDERSLYYLSEASGSFNVWRLDLEQPGEPEQLTFHSEHPVRFLSVAADGRVVYGLDGAIWSLPAGADEPRRIDVRVASDRRGTAIEYRDVSRDLSEFALSPDGSQIAFVARGEIFVTSVEHEDTRRITDTPEQERSVSFSPDGRSLLYAGERGGSWNLYRTDLADSEETAFFNATALTEKPVLVTDTDVFQPRFSPDGLEVAYLEERTTLKVLNLATGVSRVALDGGSNYSYADGDQWYDWSPDGRWFLLTSLSPGRWSNEVLLVPSSGQGVPVNLTRSGYEDNVPRWAFKGEGMFWATDRQGPRGHSGWGGWDDIHVMFFTEASWDRFRLSEAELAQVKVADEKAKKAKKKDGPDEVVEPSKPKLAEPVELDLEGREDRTRRLTIHSAPIAAAALTPDGERLLYLARFEKGFDLWSYVHRSSEIKLLAKLDAESAGGLEIDAKGEKAFVMADHRLLRVDLDKGESKPVAFSAMMEVDGAAERAHLFDHAWRQTGKKFYVEDMHGVDWDALGAHYRRFLPAIDTNWDFAELLSEMLGELNASHTGAGHRPKREGGDDTADLAFFPDPTHTGDGIGVLEIIDGSPLLKAGSEIRPGTVITAIDGVAVTAGMNWYPLLNHKAGAPLRLTLSNPGDGRSWEQRVKPISQDEVGELLYQRWVRSRRAEVDRLSGGRLGYAHVRSMDDDSYRDAFAEVFGRATGRDGLVIDTRFNSGGNLTESLATFVSGELFATDEARGQTLGTEPMLRWHKPSIVVMNEGNYSDAHCFPAAYTSLGLGETVGMQVPGTCTAVWWETLQDRSLYFGIPQVGIRGASGELLENRHLDPDHAVDNDPALEAAGRDQQLETAVEVLLASLAGG